MTLKSTDSLLNDTLDFICLLATLEGLHLYWNTIQSITEEGSTACLRQPEGTETTQICTKEYLVVASSLAYLIVQFCVAAVAAQFRASTTKSIPVAPPLLPPFVCNVLTL